MESKGQGFVPNALIAPSITFDPRAPIVEQVGRTLAQRDLPIIRAYIDEHKDGWNGPDGNFARILSKVLLMIEVEVD